MTVNTKIIYNKIEGITNTKKITKAMEMISIIKMKKIELIMKNSRLYLIYLKKILNDIQQSKNKNNNLFLQPRIKKKIIIIIISTEKGLCGSLNTNLFKKIINKINILKKEKKKIKLIIFGKKAFLFFKNFNFKIIKYIKNVENKIKFNKIYIIINILLKMYKKFKIDHIYIANNYFKNKLLQIPKIKKILPFYNKKKKKK